MTSVTRLHRATGPMTLAEASRRFLRRDAFEPTTRDTYGRTLAALVEAVAAADVAAVSTVQLEDDLFDARWADIAATTYNRHRAALLSFFGWCLERGWTAANPVALVEPRKLRRRTEDERRERPIGRDLLAELWTLDGVAGRDRLFWGDGLRDLGAGRGAARPEHRRPRPGPPRGASARQGRRPDAIPYFGLIPLALGLLAAWRAWRAADDDEGKVAGKSASVLTVAAVTFANGGDNIGVYVPVFATVGTAGIVAYSIVFLALVAVLVAVARFVATRK